MGKKGSRAAKAGAPARREPVRRKVRYAVVGLGHIAQVAVLPAFAHARKNSELVALCSDDAEKLGKVGRKYQVEHRFGYERFEEGLAESGADAVYIALPNHLHREHAERAAAADLHVLTETPMAVTEDDCRAMIDARHRHGVKLKLAYRLPLEEAHLPAGELAPCGRLGRARRAAHSRLPALRHAMARS
jgi:glucose-fructose oxidoreductase